MVRSQRFIELIIQDGLMAKVTALGEHVKAGMRQIGRETGQFTSVRGMGTLLACTFENADRRNKVLKGLFERKTIALSCGVDSLRFRLPMIMTTSEADELLDRFEASVKAAAATASV